MAEDTTRGRLFPLAIVALAGAALFAAGAGLAFGIMNDGGSSMMGSGMMDMNSGDDHMDGMMSGMMGDMEAMHEECIAMMREMHPDAAGNATSPP